MVVISLFPSLLRLSSLSFSPHLPLHSFPCHTFLVILLQPLLLNLLPSMTSLFLLFSLLHVSPLSSGVLSSSHSLHLLPPLLPSFLPSQIFSALTPLSQCEARTSCEALSVSTAPESCAFLSGKSAEIFKTD